MSGVFSWLSPLSSSPFTTKVLSFQNFSILRKRSTINLRLVQEGGNGGQVGELGYETRTSFDALPVQSRECEMCLVTLPELIVVSHPHPPPSPADSTTVTGSILLVHVQVSPVKLQIFMNPYDRMYASQVHAAWEITRHLLTRLWR